MTDIETLIAPVRALHHRIRDAVVEACTRQAAAELAAVDAEDASDTIYAIDRVSEGVLVDGLAEVARRAPICLVAEGLPAGRMLLPRGAAERDCRWCVIVDPIDGTRGLMYQKRSAWILTGLAPYRGPAPATRLSDIALAVQTEIPLVKQHLSDQLWAVRGAGVHAERHDRLTGIALPLVLHPSRADTIAHGFASLSRFFPGARDVLAAVDDELVFALLGPPPAGKASCFEDQYLSTGGQLYELMAGHDRFIADLRPLVQCLRTERGLPPGLSCHPYDICTALIAQELGVAVTDAAGAPVDAPLDVESEVAWVGYANEMLRQRVQPVLRQVLVRHGLLPGASAERVPTDAPANAG